MKVQKQCQRCGNPFEAKRRDAAFCSNLCRAHYHNQAAKGGHNQPQDMNRNQQPQQFTQQPPMFYPGLMGADNSRVADLQQQIDRLKDEKYQLQLQLIETKANAQINAKIQEFKEDQTPESGGLMGVIDKVSSNERLMNLAEKFIESKFIGSGGSETDSVFAGIEGERRDKLQALLEISKTLPDQLVDVMLGIAGKASQDPSGFLTGIREAGAPDAAAEEVTVIQERSWMP